MSAELQFWCQQKIAELLHQKEQLLKRRDSTTTDADHSFKSLPHFNSMLEAYKAIDKQEMMLLEINYRIRVLERENEIKNFKKAFSCLRIARDEVDEDNEESFVRTWMQQILSHNTMTESSDALFYDITFDEVTNSTGELKEKLTWSTKYKGHCTRISVTAKVKCRASNEEDYKFSSSFYVDGLVVEGKRYIAAGRKVDEYVRDVVWVGLQKLIDIT